MRQPVRLGGSPLPSSSTPARASSSWYAAISAISSSGASGVTSASNSGQDLTMIMNRMGFSWKGSGRGFTDGLEGLQRLRPGLRHPVLVGAEHVAIDTHAGAARLVSEGVVFKTRLPGAHRFAVGVFDTLVDHAQVPDRDELGRPVRRDLGDHALFTRAEEADGLALVPRTFEARAFTEGGGPLFIGG